MTSAAVVLLLLAAPTVEEAPPPAPPIVAAGRQPAFTVSEPAELAVPSVPLYRHWWFWAGAGVGSLIFTAGVVTALFFLAAFSIATP